MQKEKQEIDKEIHPILTVKAVVCNSDAEKVLVLKRSTKEGTYLGAYDLPGGAWEKNETVEECLQREVREETGLEIEIGSILAIREYPREHKMFNKIKALRFIAYYKGGEVKLSKEHSGFEWLTFDEVAQKLAGKKTAKENRGYEEEKRDTILLAKEYLENKGAVEKWQRVIADFENYKRQTAKQNEEFRKYATENVITEILPVIDNFQASLEHIPEEEKNGGWVTGILYIQKQLLDVLANHGVEPINVQVGDVFDANLHEAIKSQSKVESQKSKVKDSGKGSAEAQGQGTSDKKQETKNEKKVEDNKNITITKVIKDGYKIGDKIIRPAMVETS